MLQQEKDIRVKKISLYKKIPFEKKNCNKNVLICETLKQSRNAFRKVLFSTLTALSFINFLFPQRRLTIKNKTPHIRNESPSSG